MNEELHVLIVDPVMQSRMRLQNSLRGLNVIDEVEQRNSYQLLIPELEQEEIPFDVIFLRSQDDTEEQNEMLNKILSHEGKRSPLVIYVLGAKHQRSDYVAELYANGAHGFLVEPYSPEDLEEIVLFVKEAAEKGEQDSPEKQRTAGEFAFQGALSLLDTAALNMNTHGGGGKALVHLRRTNETLRKLLKDLEPEQFEEIILRRTERFVEKADYSRFEGRGKGQKKAVHRGGLLHEVMEERGLPAGRLAPLLKIEEDELNRILAEEAPISEELAQELSRVIGKSKEFWLGQ